MTLEKLTTLALSMYSNKGAYALLCGAGISRNAGIPTGWEIENDLIRQIAATKGVEMSGDWHEWYRRTFGKSAEYSKLLGDVSKTSTERVQLMRSYFEPTDEEREDGMKLPTKTHKCIAQLAKGGYVKVIITTNFDRLFETALNDIGVPYQTVYHADDIAKITPLVHSGVTVVKLNGDYLDCRFRNTSEELDSYQPELKEFLTRIFEDFGLVTCGWSAMWDKGLTEIIHGAKLTRYGSYFSYVGKTSDSLNELAEGRNADLIKIDDADRFFSELQEQVSALEKINLSKTISADLFVTRVKKYLPIPEKSIDLEELIENEGKYAQDTILKYASYNFCITPEVFRKYLDLHKQAVEKLIPAAIAVVRWGKEKQVIQFKEILIRLCLRPLVNGEFTCEGTQYLHLLASCFLFNAIGIASVKYKKFSHLKSLFKVKVPAGNVTNISSPMNLVYLVLTDHWGDDKVNSYLQTHTYSPFSLMVMNELWPYFKTCFLTENEYKQTFYAWEHLWSMMYRYYKCDPFPRIREVYYPMGIFNYKSRSYITSKDGFYYDFFTEADSMKDNWSPIVQGLFDSKYTEYEKIKTEADAYYRKNIRL